MIKFKHDDWVEGERVNVNTETTMRSQDQNWKIRIEIFFFRHNTKMERIFHLSIERMYGEIQANSSCQTMPRYIATQQTCT